jgi:hypothetical protein
MGRPRELNSSPRCSGRSFAAAGFSWEPVDDKFVDLMVGAVLAAEPS